MQAIESEGILTKKGSILLPESVRKQLSSVKKVKMIIIYEEETWDKVTSSQFLKGYSEGDAIYDKL